MRSNRLLLAVPLLLSSAALAQSHVRLSYEMAKPEGNTSRFIDNSFSTIGGHLDVSLEVSYAFHFELSAGLNSFNTTKVGILTTTDGQDVYGKQYRYLNVVPLMAGFAFHVPLGGGSRIWVGCNGGVGYFDRVIDLGLTSYSGSSWQWGIQPQVGIAFGLGGGTALFFDGRYNYFWAKDGWPTQAYWSFGAGLLFGGSGKSASPKK